jgi:hypothetical protein
MSTGLVKHTDVRTANSAQQAAGWAALGQAGTFIVGMVLFATVIASADYGALDIDPAEHVTFLSENILLLNIWYSAIYLAFGALLVVLALALQSRLRSSFTARVGTAFGLIWATLMFAVGMTAVVGSSMVVELNERDSDLATSTWTTIQVLIQGMGGGIELVGGLWIGLVSLAGLRMGALPRRLNQLGLGVGAAGILTTTLFLPDVLTAAFGLGLIVWYVWIGLFLVRERA